MAKLKIRAEQWAAFEEDAQDRFEDRLVATMQNCWADVCGELGEEGARQRVKTALERARGHGFEEQEHLTRFVHLAFMFTADFDDSDATPWGRNILSWELPLAKRLDRLERAAQEEQERRG